MLYRAAGVYLFLCFFNFLSLKFQNIKFLVTLFCEANKVETWYTHGQRVDLLCTPNTSSQNILVPLFFFFFLSLQLTKVKNLHLQNCFNLPLMATAGGMWALLTLCYIFSKFSGGQNFSNFCVTFEPAHEIMALFILCKLILQTRMCRHPVGIDVWCLVGPFVYFHTLCVRTVKALTRLRRCAGSPEPSLVAYMISSTISLAGSFLL